MLTSTESVHIGLSRVVKETGDRVVCPEETWGKWFFFYMQSVCMKYCRLDWTSTSAPICVEKSIYLGWTWESSYVLAVIGRNRRWPAAETANSLEKRQLNKEVGYTPWQTSCGTSISYEPFSHAAQTWQWHWQSRRHNWRSLIGGVRDH